MILNEFTNLIFIISHNFSKYRNNPDLVFILLL